MSTPVQLTATQKLLLDAIDASIDALFAGGAEQPPGTPVLPAMPGYSSILPNVQGIDKRPDMRQSIELMLMAIANPNVWAILANDLSLSGLIDGPLTGAISGAFEELLPANSPFPTSMTWWTSVAKTARIVDETLTYNANKTVNTHQWRMYAPNGVTVLSTVTDTYNYAAGFLTPSRTRVIV